MDITLTNIDSNLITEVKYNIETKSLFVEFLGTSKYEYKDVPETIFYSIIEAESKGKYINSIKNDYEYTKCDEEEHNVGNS